MPENRRPERFDQSSVVYVIGGSRRQFAALREEMQRRGLGEPVPADQGPEMTSAQDGARRVYVLGSGLDSRQTIELLDELNGGGVRAPAVVLREDGEREFSIECFRHGAVEVLNGPDTAPDWSSRLGCWLSPRAGRRNGLKH
jgi:hypothetical protein